MQGSIKERLLFHLGQTNNLSYLCNVETNILTYFYCDEHIIVVKSPNQFSSSPSSSTTPSAALVFSCLFLEDEESNFLDPREDQDRGFVGAEGSTFLTYSSFFPTSLLGLSSSESLVSRCFSSSSPSLSPPLNPYQAPIPSTRTPAAPAARYLRFPPPSFSSFASALTFLLELPLLPPPPERCSFDTPRHVHTS